LEECEKRIQSKIERLNPNDLLKGKDRIMQMTAKLRKGPDAHSQETAQHVAIIQPIAKDLTELEVIAQQNFIASAFDPNKWKNMLK